MVSASKSSHNRNWLPAQRDAPKNPASVSATADPESPIVIVLGFASVVVLTELSMGGVAASTCTAAPASGLVVVSVSVSGAEAGASVASLHAAPSRVSGITNARKGRAFMRAP